MLTLLDIAINNLLALNLFPQNYRLSLNVSKVDSLISAKFSDLYHKTFYGGHLHCSTVS